MWQTEVKVDGPYLFKRALKRLSADPAKLINIERESIVVPLVIADHAYAVTIQHIGTTQKPFFRLSGDVLPEHEHKVVKEISRIFQWDVSYKLLAQHFKDTDLGPLFVKLEGTPLVLDFSLYFSLMKSIIHQQLNLTFSHTLTARFVQTFGFQKDGVWFPPSADTVSELAYEDLTALQFSRRKAEYVIDTSRLISSGELQLESFHTLSNENIINTLTSVRGIGPWTAESLLLFGLGRPSIFPYADVGIQNGLKKWYKLDAKPSREQMEKWRKPWAPYETYAALYLWEFLDDPSLTVGDNGMNENGSSS